MRPLAAGAASLSIVLAAGACTSAKSTSNNSGAPSTQAAAGGQSNTSSSGGVKSFVWAVGEDFTSLDPSSIQSQGNAYADGVRNSTLLQYKLPPASPDPSSCTTLANPPALEPTNLVKSWSTSSDGKHISFTLNQGVKSQYGNTLTSTDVQWSIQREQAVDPIGTLLMYTLGGFDKANPITVTGPDTFTLNVSNPTTVTDLELTEIWQEIFDSQAVKANAGPSDPWGKKWLTDHVADFGPYKLANFVPGQSVSYEPNPNYDGSKGNIGNVTVKIVTDASTRQEILQTGSAQAADALSFDQYASLGNSKSVGIVKCASPARDFLGFDVRSAPLSNVLVRQAISLATNRQQIAQSVYRGYAQPAKSGVASVFAPTAGTSNFVYDPAKAKQLLAQAGYSKGFALSLAIAPSSTGAYVTTLAEYLQQELSQIGITVKIQTVPTASEFKADLSKGLYQAFIDTESPDFSDPGYAYILTNGCQGLQSFGGWCNKSDEALALQVEQATAAGPQRTALINQLSTVINDQVPVDYLTEVPAITARANCITGMPGAFPTWNDYVSQASSSC